MALSLGPAAVSPGDRGEVSGRRGLAGPVPNEPVAIGAGTPGVPPVAGAAAEARADGGESGPRGRDSRSAAPFVPAAPVLAGSASLAYQALATPADVTADTAATSPPPASADIGPFAGEPHEQVVRAIRLQWIQGIGEAHLRLSPEHLGEVTIHLRVERGLVTASLRGDSAAAVERIRAHEADLRAALEEQGLTLDRFELAVDPDARRRGRHAADWFLEPGRRRRPDAPGSTFEVTA